MKRTGKTYTLRGSFPMELNGSTVFSGELAENIFSYDSFDQTKGWIVKNCWAWIDMIDGTGGGDSRLGLQFCLTTDTLNANAGGSITGLKDFLEQYRPQDNRTIAWNQQDVHRRDNVNKDFIMPTNAFIDTCSFLIDEDRIITRDLFLQGYGTTEGATVTTNVNYFIALEEVELTPTENIMSQIKGISQSIT